MWDSFSKWWNMNFISFKKKKECWKCNDKDPFNDYVNKKDSFIEFHLSVTPIQKENLTCNTSLTKKNGAMTIYIDYVCL